MAAIGMAVHIMLISLRAHRLAATLVQAWLVIAMIFATTSASISTFARHTLMTEEP